jgi:hypothetical protein
VDPAADLSLVMYNNTLTNKDFTDYGFKDDGLIKLTSDEK